MFDMELLGNSKRKYNFGFENTINSEEWKVRWIQEVFYQYPIHKRKIKDAASFICYVIKASRDNDKF